MFDSTRRIKIMLAILVGLFLLAGVARELMIRHVRSLGVDFPNDWSLVNRTILWQPPEDAVLEEAITDELARRLKWLSGFKMINTLSYLDISPGFFRELGVQKKVTWVSIWSKISNEQVADLQIFPNVVHMELVDSELSCETFPLFPKMEWLQVRGPLSKSGVDRLAMQPSLRELHIDDARLEKEDILKLLKNPQLKILLADECYAMSKADLQSFREMRPDVSFLLEFKESTGLEVWYSDP